MALMMSVLSLATFAISAHLWRFEFLLLKVRDIRVCVKYTVPQKRLYHNAYYVRLKALWLHLYAPAPRDLDEQAVNGPLSHKDVPAYPGTEESPKTPRTQFWASGVALLASVGSHPGECGGGGSSSWSAWGWSEIQKGDQ